MSLSIPTPRSGGSATAAALTLLVLGLVSVALRPALPFDETRYLEVARELGSGNPLLLRLDGAPYSHKPPLAFWLGHLLASLGVPLEVGMRSLPALALAATVVAVERIGRRAGQAGGAWLFASMLVPALYAQALLVDPLLCACVWWSLEAWTRERDGRATLFAALAFLAKGPVAAVHLLPLCWALAPLRSRGRTWRSLVVVLGGALPLAAWALYSARAGGEAFARELLVEQTSGRLVDSFAHARSPLIYLATLGGGALPLLPSLALGRPASALRRLPWAVLGVVAFFCLISGKQPHYLLPLFPALALWAAEVLGRDARGAARLHRTTLAIALVALVVVALTPWLAPLVLEPPLDAQVRQLTGSTPGLLLWLLSTGLVTAALVALLRHPRRIERAPVLVLVALLGLALPSHNFAGRVVYPRELAAVLRSLGDEPLVGYRAYRHGTLNWLARRDHVEVLREPEELVAWCELHPGGLVALPTKHAQVAPASLSEVVVRDHVRGEPYELRRVAATADGG